MTEKEATKRIWKALGGLEPIIAAARSRNGAFYTALCTDGRDAEWQVQGPLMTPEEALDALVAAVEVVAKRG